MERGRIPAAGGRDDAVQAQMERHLAVVVGVVPDHYGGQAEARVRAGIRALGQIVNDIDPVGSYQSPVFSSERGLQQRWGRNKTHNPSADSFTDNCELKTENVAQSQVTSHQSRIVTYREFVQNGLSPRMLAQAIAERSGRERISEVFLSPDAFAHRTSEASIAEQLGDVLVATGLPTVG